MNYAQNYVDGMSAQGYTFDANGNEYDPDGNYQENVHEMFPDLNGAGQNPIHDTQDGTLVGHPIYYSWVFH